MKKIKQKTKRGAAKRFKVSASGKVRFRRANRAHGNFKKKMKKMRAARANGQLAPADAKLARRLMALES